jgi:hypothetical protein
MTANPISHALQQYSVKTIWGFSIPMDISQTKAAIPAHKKKRKTLYILLSLIPEKFKKDISTPLIEKPNERYFAQDHSNLIGKFNETFFNVWYAEYAKYFSVLNNSSKHGIYSHKIQQTVPGGGYHVWHFEASSFDSSRRLGVYILYLNDIEEGGETEFLYLNQRIKPKKGRLVIFPSGYVFTHRGNPPLSGEKYIMTGWLEYMQ